MTLDWGTNRNNGDLQGAVYNHGGPGFPQLLTFNAAYFYDSVQRVTAANETSASACGGTCWYRNFSYDQYGNQPVTANGGLALNGTTPQSNGSYNPYNPATNQLLSGSYDAAGNQRVLGGLSIWYDAEERQDSTYDSSSGLVQYYYYDDQGRRVLKQTTGGSTTTVYVYDALGQLAMEYSPAATTLSKEYIHFGGQIAAIENAGSAACQTCYLSYDHLGSVRLVTDQNANVIARHDFIPFGEEILPPYGGRTSQWGAADNVSQRFTGQERDQETQLDFFNARYFSGALGRFTSPDPANAGADLTDPQTWNGYAYVRNNPLALVDPSGMTSCQPGTENTCVDVNGNAPDDVDLFALGPTSSCFLFNCGGFVYSVTTYAPPSVAEAASTSGQGSLPPNSKVCTSGGYTTARKFVNTFSNPADQIAQRLKTAISNILGLAGFESGWGTGPLIKAGTNNYFSLKAGPAFAKGATGTYRLGPNVFETYPSFQASGNAFANSYFGTRVTGITDPVAFAQALNAGGRYNSEQRTVPYNTTLVNTINLSAQILQCP